MTLQKVHRFADAAGKFCIKGVVTSNLQLARSLCQTFLIAPGSTIHSRKINIFSVNNLISHYLCERFSGSSWTVTSLSRKLGHVGPQSCDTHTAASSALTHVLYQRRQIKPRRQLSRLAAAAPTSRLRPMQLTAL